MTLVKINNCEAFIVSLNLDKITKNPENIKIKPFTNKYNCEKINFVSEKDDWKRIEKNNVTIGLTVLHEKIYPAYVSKHNLNREKQFILLMISNGGKG